VEVEIAQLGVAPVPEAMDDEWRRERECAGGEHALLSIGADEERQLAREHVEEIGVAAMNVRAGAVAVRAEPRPGRVQLVLVAEDLYPPLGRVAHNLALARH
jgi:hypothetical protein